MSATEDPEVLAQTPASRLAGYLRGGGVIVPLLTVTLAFLAGVNATPLTPLGVTGFGQSGDLGEVYDHHGIDAETIVGAALDLVD